jgi:prevent-host-death family protein
MTMGTSDIMAPKRISAALFKATCLKVLDEVARTRTPVVVTKRGKPVAKLVPADEKAPELFGFLRGTGTIKGDIISPLEDKWEAND